MNDSEEIAVAAAAIIIGVFKSQQVRRHRLRRFLGEVQSCPKQKEV
jgi:hypothetical protein